MRHAKGGRPKKAPQFARTQQLSIRFSPDEYRRMQSKAAAADMTVTEYCRSAALDKRLTSSAVATPDFATRQSLQRIGNNLNQIAKRLNAQPHSSAPLELEGALRNLQAIMARWLEHDPTGG